MIQGADGRINCYRCSGCHTSCQTTGKWQRYNWIVILKEISSVVSVFVAANHCCYKTTCRPTLFAMDRPATDTKEKPPVGNNLRYKEARRKNAKNTDNDCPAGC